MPIDPNDVWCLEPNKEPPEPKFGCPKCGQINCWYEEDEMCDDCHDDLPDDFFDDLDAEETR